MVTAPEALNALGDTSEKAFPTSLRDYTSCLMKIIPSVFKIPFDDLHTLFAVVKNKLVIRNLVMAKGWYIFID